MPNPNSLSLAIQCPLCHHPIRNPATLLCGHSLCAHHLSTPTPSCPLPNCPHVPPAPPPPPNARVLYIPAPPAVQPPYFHHRNTDVSLSNLVSLVNRTTQRLAPPLEDHRPRKRHKPSDDEPDLLRDFDKKLLDELTCHVCYLLFYQPVTTPCQHTYCAKCLQRSLDHSPSCPICRKPLLTSFIPVNKAILSIILIAYPDLYQERAAAIEEEERHARLNTPIFVCQLSFPGVPTILHFFEPRYRLMLRRCLESPNPRFGMIMSPKSGSPQSDYGTMLEIRSVQMLPDGRSVVQTWGSSRFRILERGSLDGYMVGRIERIDDFPDDVTDSLFVDESAEDSDPSPCRTAQQQDRTLFRRITRSLSRPSSTTPEGPSTAIPARPQRLTNEDLMNTCKTFLDRLQRGAAPWVVQRLSSTYGKMPTDPALFSFWVALVLPLEEQEKAKLLPIRSARMRLVLVVHWIQELNNNWWFANGCTIM